MEPRTLVWAPLVDGRLLPPPERLKAATSVVSSPVCVYVFLVLYIYIYILNNYLGGVVLLGGVSERWGRKT